MYERLPVFYNTNPQEGHNPSEHLQRLTPSSWSTFSSASIVQWVIWVQISLQHPISNPSVTSQPPCRSPFHKFWADGLLHLPIFFNIQSMHHHSSWAELFSTPHISWKVQYKEGTGCLGPSNLHMLKFCKMMGLGSGTLETN